MKAKHDFPDQESYKDYLKTYISIKAMQSLLLDINLEEELDPDEISTTALDMANSLIGKLLDAKEAAIMPTNSVTDTVVEIKAKPENVTWHYQQTESNNTNTISEKPKKNTKRQEAEDWMKMGNALFSQKAYKSALANYLKANELFPHKSTDNAIEQCNKWIKALSQMQEEPIKQDSEFNYIIPTLE